MTVFRAGPEHASVVGRLLHDFNVEFESPTPSASELAARFAVLLEGEDQLALVSGSAEEPTGFAYLTLRGTPYYDGPVALLEELYVVPSRRDRGIGTALLTRAVTEVLQRGGIEVHINVDEVDTDTRRFYERHGFTNIQPGEDFRMLCYLRELT